MNPPDQPNTLGNASLILSILSLAFVFGIGLCALTGLQQPWIQLAGTPLFVCGGSSAFLGLLGAVLGAAGLTARGRSRSTAIAGLALGILGVCLFLGVLGLISRGG